jgi:hypothetical protein
MGDGLGSIAAGITSYPEVIEHAWLVVPAQTVGATPIESVNFIMLLRNDLPAGAIFNWSLNRALFFEFRFRERMPPLKLLHLDVELALR